VLVGRGGYLITQDLKTGLHVRLVAPRAWRIHKVAADRNLSPKDAERIVAEGERERNRFLHAFFLHDPAHPFHHDLVIDSARFNLAQIVEIIFTALSSRFGEALVNP
jgi:cytidylate kinase